MKQTMNGGSRIDKSDQDRDFGDILHDFVCLTDESRVTSGGEGKMCVFDYLSAAEEDILRTFHKYKFSSSHILK